MGDITDILDGLNEAYDRYDAFVEEYWEDAEGNPKALQRMRNVMFGEPEKSVKDAVADTFPAYNPSKERFLAPFMPWKYDEELQSAHYRQDRDE